MSASPVIEIPLANEAETLALGKKLAGILKDTDVIALFGDLGAGKTTLARGLIQAFSPDAGEVPSPTYTIVQTYDEGGQTLWHFDLYRIEDPSELRELGFEEAIEDIALIEWPEHAGSLLPEHRLSLSLRFEGEGRVACLTATTPEWIDRLNEHFASN